MPHFSLLKIIEAAASIKEYTVSDIGWPTPQALKVFGHTTVSSILNATVRAGHLIAVNV